MSVKRWAGVISLSLLSTLGGCLSVDIDDELAEVRGLVAARGETAPAWSPEPAPARAPDRPLTLGEATRRALEGHPTLKAEMARLAEARADRVQAGLLPNPMVMFDYGLVTDGGGGSPLMVAAVQQISALWKRPARVGSAEAELRARLLFLGDAVLRLGAEVRTLYSDVVHGDRQLELDARLVATRRLHLDITELLRAAGEATQRDVNASRLELARVTDRQIRGREVLERARRRLLERIGEPLRESSDLQLDVASLRLPDSLPSEPDVYELTAQQRLDVAAAFAAVEGAEAGERLARWKRLGEMEAGVVFMKNFSNREGVFPRVGWSPPIFDSGYAAVAKARAIERRSLHEADRILWNALLEARLAHVGLTTARSRLEQIERDWLPPALDNVELSRRSFEAGSRNRLALLEDEARALEVQRERIDIQRSLHATLFELERAVGGRLGGPVESPTDSTPGEEVDREHS